MPHSAKARRRQARRAGDLPCPECPVWCRNQSALTQHFNVQHALPRLATAGSSNLQGQELATSFTQQSIPPSPLSEIPEAGK